MQAETVRAPARHANDDACARIGHARSVGGDQESGQVKVHCPIKERPHLGIGQVIGKCDNGVPRGDTDKVICKLQAGARQGPRVEAEALKLNRRDTPAGDTMMVDGKGGKQRLVPVLPLV